jgi:hypothetical protein
MRHCVEKDIPKMPGAPIKKIGTSRVSKFRFNRVTMDGAKNSGKNIPKVRSNLCVCTYAILPKADKLNIIPQSMEEFIADFIPLSNGEALNEHWAWNDTNHSENSSVYALDEQAVLNKLRMLEEGLPPIEELIPCDAESLFSLASIKMFATCCLTVIS